MQEKTVGDVIQELRMQGIENERKNKAKDYTDSVIKDIHDYVAPKGVVDTVPEDASILKDIGGELM